MFSRTYYTMPVIELATEFEGFGIFEASFVAVKRFHNESLYI